MPHLAKSQAWRQLLAMVYDAFLVAPLLMANAFVLVSVFGPTDSIARPTVPDWIMQSTSLLIIMTFFVIFWHKSGQTLGMQAWRIKLVNDLGKPASVKQAYIRCVAACLSFLLFGAGYWWMFFHPQNRTWHDLISKTHLERFAKEAKAQ
ncbi:RDD family protein [Luminiphilus sp. nBUS_07]|uniref:RDD family protein n=1 Tax=Luminiphilus sp. nBUS_07 TaxID=3395314 RepID=UPI003EB6D1E8